MSAKSPSDCSQEQSVITVFLTGNVRGELKPCGCFGGQLGGFDRRAAVLRRAQPSRRLLVDTGSFVAGAGEQDLIKFNMISRALAILDYDVVSLTGEDLEKAQNTGLLEEIQSTFSVIGPEGVADVNLPEKFTKQFLLKDRTVAITVAAFDAGAGSTEQIKELFASLPSEQPTVNILILNRCDSDIVASVEKLGIVDCLVCPPESDEAAIIGDPKKRPLVVSVGRYGKYVGMLRIKAKKDGGELTLSFSGKKVHGDLPAESSLVELYESYQQLVRDYGLLENYPRFVLPGGLEYVGSKSCKHCHAYEYEKWSGKAHASVYASLVEVGSQFDPECVVCHVVGMNYESGFVSERSPEDLRNVGCENCHGPGSEHVKSQGSTETTEPKSQCTDCHTPDHSAEYAGNEQIYLEKIIHWREPNNLTDVKN